MLPNMDGFTLIEALDELEVDIPVFVLTAKDLSNKEISTLEGSVEKIILKNGLDSQQLMIELERTIMALNSEERSAVYITEDQDR
jgi:DNA-binding response OmpR family regulator